MATSRPKAWTLDWKAGIGGTDCHGWGAIEDAISKTEEVWRIGRGGSGVELEDMSGCTCMWVRAGLDSGWPGADKKSTNFQGKPDIGQGGGHLEGLSYYL